MCPLFFAHAHSVKAGSVFQKGEDTHTPSSPHLSSTTVPGDAKMRRKSELQLKQKNETPDTAALRGRKGKMKRVTQAFVLTREEHKVCTPSTVALRQGRKSRKNTRACRECRQNVTGQQSGCCWKSRPVLSYLRILELQGWGDRVCCSMLLSRLVRLVVCCRFIEATSS